MTVNRTSGKAQTGRPTSGPTRGGPSYGLEDVVTLLPTPAVNDMGASYTPDEWDAWTATMQAKHGNGNGHGKSLSIEAQRLLPTPQAHDAQKGKTAEQVAAMRARGHGVANLNETIENLLPTPVSDNSRSLTSDSTDFQSLPNEVAYRWGDYAPAVARWEAVTGRTAPAPTEPGPKGNPRLSPAFVEWLMGLPAGHVTDVGLTRNEQLKALGNGVVPQQAAAATQAFLTDLHMIGATA